jgi:hypothetical protein
MVKCPLGGWRFVPRGVQLLGAREHPGEGLP